MGKIRIKTVLVLVLVMWVVFAVSPSSVWAASG